MLQAVIFDMDGVLIDSAPSAELARLKHFALQGIDLTYIPDPHGEGHKGNSFSSIVKLVKNVYPDTVIDEAAFTKGFVADAYKDLLERNISVDRELVALLQELRSHDVACAITSSSKHASVDVKLDILGIRNYFTVVVTAEDAERHKPYPDLYLQTVDKLQVEPANCVVFEDSSAGVAAGCAAGCKVVGFTRFAKDNEVLNGVMKSINRWSAISYGSLVNISNMVIKK